RPGAAPEVAGAINHAPCAQPFGQCFDEQLSIALPDGTCPSTPGGPYRLRGGARAVRFPAGRAEHVAEPLAPIAGRSHVVNDAGPFMERDAQGIERAEVLDDAVAARLGIVFRHEGAEQLVPDDQ